MIGIPELLVVAGVFALVAGFVWIIHRILSAVERADGGAGTPRLERLFPPGVLACGRPRLV
jgi:hypothetical protein